MKTDSPKTFRLSPDASLTVDVAIGGRDPRTVRFEGRRKVYMLPLEKLRPSIRIAHRPKSALNVPERIILDHELVLILAGSGTLSFGSNAVVFKAHDLFFIPPFERHTFVSAPGSGEHIAVHFDLAAQFPAFATRLPRRLPYQVQFAHGLSLPRHSVLRPGDPVRSWLNNIVTLFACGEPLARLQADALLLNVLARLFKGQAAAAPKAIDSALHVRITQALDFLEANLARRLTPADLACAAGLSSSHFSRVFRRWTGFPPGEYVLRRRVEEARKLLGNVRLSIKEVAARSGFADPYYFSKVFRRIDGLPPTHFRQALLIGHP